MFYLGISIIFMYSLASATMNNLELANMKAAMRFSTFQGTKEMRVELKENDE